MNIYYQITKFNDKKIIKKYPITQSRSFVKGFIDRLYGSIAQVSYHAQDLFIHSVGGDGGYYMSYGLSNTYIGWIAKSSEQGIVVGTSTTALSPSQTILVAKVNHGQSTGELLHYACYPKDFSTNTSDCTFELERIFWNNSGGSITVNEMGIYNVLSTALTTGSLIARDLVSPGVAVANGEYLKITYTIKVSI